MAYGEHCKVDRALTRREVVQAELGALDQDLDAFLALIAELRIWAAQCDAQGNHATAVEIRAGIQAALAEWAAKVSAG
jgi:hypothetical protein